MGVSLRGGRSGPAALRGAVAGTARRPARYVVGPPSHSASGCRAKKGEASEMHAEMQKCTTPAGGSAASAAVPPSSAGDKPPPRQPYKKRTFVPINQGLKGVTTIETELKKIHITTQAEYWNLCMEYLSAEQYAGRFGCHLATAYRHFASVPDSCKALVINDVTGSQYTVIPKATAKTVYETQQPPGNPQLTTQHQREAAQARWHGRQGRST